ncbi:MAG: methyl-accepting chemotaxis protein [Chitinispirillales bacterium]|jgi:PAS domain S-box-containing protein|nr:methyl-accepting chemotaxis protein [Chitinispirillales bacterium]
MQWFKFLTENKFTKTLTVVFIVCALFIDALGGIVIRHKVNAAADETIFILFAACLMILGTVVCILMALWICNKIHWYESILDALPFPLSITDKNMNWTFINKVVEDLQKVKRKDVIGKQCSNWGAAICETSNCGIECLRRGENHTFFEQFGSDFKVEVRYLYDGYGNITGHIEVVQDITDLKKIQKQQAVLIENIGGMNRNFVSISSDVTNSADENVKTTSQTVKMISSIRENAEKCSQYMEKMTQAMTEINNASRDIVNVTKTISDIASRTNILAINASIEAARAGEAGKGFAVVAKEVKNLASQSAKSVNDTKSLVNNSITKADYGMQMVKDAADSLAEIVSGINTSNNFISGIAEISKTQKNSIADINKKAEEMALLLKESDTN